MRVINEDLFYDTRMNLHSMNTNMKAFDPFKLPPIFINSAIIYRITLFYNEMIEQIESS